MTRWMLALFLLPVLINAQAPNHNPNAGEPPILGPHWARGTQVNASTATSNDLLYHGGPILVTPTVKAVFWGSTWGTSPGDKIVGLNAWYKGIAKTRYEATVDEYTDSSGHRVSSALNYSGYRVDKSSAPKSPSTSQVLAEVCRQITTTVSSGYYPVYVDQPRKGNFCAYHSWGSCGGVKVQFAFFWKLDGDAGCDPLSSLTGQSEGLKALANVSGHELSEARSDPRGNGWYSNGGENGDLCAWTFGGLFVSFTPPSGTSSKYDVWKIQGNWSNKAANGTSPNGPGYRTALGRGCVDGTNYPGPYLQ
jgi:hypothetical protein